MNPIKNVGTQAESTLNILASAILVIGIVSFLFFFIGGCGRMDDYYGGIGIAFVAYGFAILIGSIITWASIRVIINISLRLSNIETLLSPAEDNDNVAAEEAQVAAEEVQDLVVPKVGENVRYIADDKIYKVIAVEPDGSVLVELGFLAGNKWLTYDEYYYPVE